MIHNNNTQGKDETSSQPLEFKLAVWNTSTIKHEENKTNVKTQTCTRKFSMENVLLR